MFFACSKYNYCPACSSWHYLPAMATIIPVAATFFTVFITVSVSGDASECAHSNIEILSQFIDARINATVNARATAALLEEKFDTAFDEIDIELRERIAAIVNTTVVNALTASIDERIRAVNTTVSALNAKTARFIISQPGEVVQCTVQYQSIPQSPFCIYSDRDTALCSNWKPKNSNSETNQYNKTVCR